MSPSERAALLQLLRMLQEYENLSPTAKANIMLVAEGNQIHRMYELETCRDWAKHLKEWIGGSSFSALYSALDDVRETFDKMAGG